ncbi:MAG: J domain-containing protein [Bacteroidaceae bacterium]|nr:J domain-containing protein [Bacteroidaceae bacterium]
MFSLRWILAIVGLVLTHNIRGAFGGFAFGWLLEQFFPRLRRNKTAQAQGKSRSRSKRTAQGYSRDEGQYQRTYQQNHSTSWVDSNEEAYRILGVQPTASNDELRQAYRRLALLYHPDRIAARDEASRQQAEKMFQLINEARDRIWRLRGM